MSFEKELGFLGLETGASWQNGRFERKGIMQQRAGYILLLDGVPFKAKNSTTKSFFSIVIVAF